MSVAIYEGRLAFGGLQFHVPFAPVAKARPRVTTVGGHARAYTPAKTVRAETALRLAVDQQLPKPWEPLREPIRVEIDAYRAMPKSIPKKRWDTARPTTKPDADNYAKTVLDGLNGLVWADDASVVDLVVRKLYTLNAPCWVIRVQEASNRWP